MSKNGKSTEERVVMALEDRVDGENLITLSTGVVLRGIPAPALALVKVMAAFPRPKPPLYHNDILGRMVENPADPDYIGQLESHRAEQSAAMLNALILLGTEFVSAPKKFSTPESDDWVEKCREIGLEIHPEKKNWRYLNWVLFVAAPKAEDTQAIQKVVGRLSGVPESDVQAAEQFSGNE